MPYLRPLCTIVGDSLRDYGVDEVGGRVHDLLGTRLVGLLCTIWSDEKDLGRTLVDIAALLLINDRLIIDVILMVGKPFLQDEQESG